MNADRVYWGTEAFHKLGDISRDDGDFFWLETTNSNGDAFGCWLTGIGFINVRYPAGTWRPITWAEESYLENKELAID